MRFRHDRLCRVLTFLLLQPALAYASDTAGTRPDDDITIRLSASADKGEARVFPSILRLQLVPTSLTDGTNGDIFMNGPWPYSATGVLFQARTATPHVVAKLGTADANSAFAVYTSSDLPLFRVRGDGFVGIGTSTPASKLDVAGSVNASGLTVNGMQISNTRFQQANNDMTSGLFVVGSDYSTMTGCGYLILNRPSGAGSYGSIQVGDNGAYQGLALNPNGGNVGIGTTSPGSLLHLYTAPTNPSHSYLKIESGNGGTQAALELKNSATANADWIEYIPGGTSDLRFYRNGDVLTIQAG